MTEIDALLIQAVVAGVVGLGQCLLIAWGILGHAGQHEKPGAGHGSLT